MIKINSSVKLSFMFPAERALAYAYYSDMQRMVSHLQHISLTESVTEGVYRLYYNTVELGTYHIHVYLDVRLEASDAQDVLRILPVKTQSKVKTEVTLNATTTHGYYYSEARFFDLGESTRIEYDFTLKAKPPRPKGLRFMPAKMVDKIAQNITKHRVKEVAETFIDSSIDAFPLWLAERTALTSTEPI